MTLDLSMCKTRYKFECENPVLLAHLRQNQSVVSSKDNSVDVIQVVPREGIQTVCNLNTENNEVYAACLLFGNQHGVSMPPYDYTEEFQQQKETLILGCNNGNVYKY